MDVRYQYIRELPVKRQHIILEYKSSSDMISDILTKPLASEFFLKLRDGLLGITWGIIHSVLSTVIHVVITPAVQLKMVENPQYEYLTGKLAEQCHLLSQSKYPRDKDKDGNIIYLSGFMHEHFDGIGMEDTHVPSFMIQYLSQATELETIIAESQEFRKYRVNTGSVFVHWKSLHF